MTTDLPKYRLGLDLGTNSIGWAAVKLDENGEPYGVIDMGVRIFPDGRNPTDKTSNAASRRVARGARRRRDRYLKRRADLIQALVEYGLMPRDEAERKALEGLDPYVLRVRALDHRLEPHELGRALFHLNQRRGFKSNRKAAGDDDEAKKTRAEISALRGSIEESGARTLGEFLARRHEKDKTVRARPGQNLYPDRAMYEAEFDAIRAAQEPHYDLSPEQWDELRDRIIFFQRSLKPVEPGHCQFEEGKRRAARALPIVQEFRMLQEVNNLRLRVGIDPERPLDDGERRRAMARLRSGRDIKLSEGRDKKPATPTRDLGLPSGSAFNLSRGGRKSIEGDATARRLIKEKGRNGRELFGSRWLSLSIDERNEIVRFMLETEEPEVVRRKAVEEWGLTHAQAEAVANVSLPGGYSNLSEKAIRKLLPHLEAGRIYSCAVLDAGYPHHSDFRNSDAHERLPYYGKVLERDVVGTNPNLPDGEGTDVDRYGRIGNPTVHIGLGQLQRVVNRLIEVYGKPDEIVVELARDLKRRRDCQKQKPRPPRCGNCLACWQREALKNKERNERLKKMIESTGQSVTPHVLRKLRLWEEQGLPQARICPYTGKTLCFEMVASAATEIDHILPFSRTLDDSMANKVVCVAAANRDKGDRSPFEAFGHSPAGYDYQSILERVAKMPNKRWRFDQNAMGRFEGEGGFLDRQLNETRYLSRTARTYLAHLYDEKTEGKQRVRVVPGRMTALLRRGWGLEEMLRANEEGEVIRKQRNDHRHHAIDAFVVANTTQGLLQRFAHAAGSSHDAEEKLTKVAGNILPWEGFDREDVRPFLDDMVVSYKPDRGTRGIKGKTTGQLHNETAYGLIEFSENDPSKVVVRKSLDKLKRADLEPVEGSAPRKGVQGLTLRSALLELWDEVGCKSDEFVRRAAEGVLLNGRRQPVRRVRVVDEQRVIPIRHGPRKQHLKGYLPGGNEFADIWKMPDGSWQMVVVPKFDASRREFDLNKFRPHREAKRLMRLQIDDMGALGEGLKRRIVRVRKMWTEEKGVYVALDDHNEANVDARITESRKRRSEGLGHEDIKEKKYSARQLQELGFRKIRVDAIGRVRDPGPPKL